jgi:DNA-binding GntR family transcriptional regulator
MPVPPTPDPVPTSPLRREEAERRLRGAIVRGELRPGERLREDELAAWLGVSRTPIREALSRLAALGLVELDANRGARVAPLDPDEMLDLVQVSRALVVLLRQLVAQRGTPAQYAELRALHDARLSHVAAGDGAAAEADLFEFHDRLLQIAGNRELERIYPSVSLRLERMVRMAYVEGVGSLGGNADMVLREILDQREVDGVRELSIEGWHELEVGIRALAERLRAAHGSDASNGVHHPGEVALTNGHG